MGTANQDLEFGMETFMRLRQWMDNKNVDVLQAAEKFGVSIHTVKKWLRLGQKDCRVPRPAMQKKIKELTSGDVMPNDWVV